MRDCGAWPPTVLVTCPRTGPNRTGSRPYPLGDRRLRFLAPRDNPVSRRGSRSTERHRLRRALGACASCAAPVFVSCAPAGMSAPGQIRPDLLYVADRGAGTLSLLDGTGAHALGRAVPVGPAPALLAAGSAGRALISSSDPEQQ